MKTNAYSGYLIKLYSLSLFAVLKSFNSFSWCSLFCMLVCLLWFLSFSSHFYYIDQSISEYRGSLTLARLAPQQRTGKGTGNHSRYHK
jgi:hypothetical protein